MEDMVAKTQTPLQRILLISLGWILTLVGIAGLFLPVLPGLFLIVAGALMLCPRSVWPQRAEKYRARFPALDRALTRFSAWAKGRAALGNDMDSSTSRSTV